MQSGRREVTITSESRTYDLTELEAGTEYTVELYILYEGGNTSPKATVSFITGGTGGMSNISQLIFF